MIKNKDVDTIISEADKEQKEIIQKLFEIIEESSPNIQCAIRWRKITFGLNDDFHHWICAINPTKKYVGLSFHFGSYLTDHSNILVTKTSRFLRQIEIAKLTDINDSAIVDLINQAVDKLDEFKQTWKQK